MIYIYIHALRMHLNAISFRLAYFYTQLKIAQVVTALLVEQWCNNMVIMVEQCCSTNDVLQRTKLFNEQCCSTNNVVQLTMLFNEQCCSTNNVVQRTILFNERCCSTNNVVERTILPSIDEATTVVHGC